MSANVVWLDMWQKVLSFAADGRNDKELILRLMDGPTAPLAPEEVARATSIAAGLVDYNLEESLLSIISSDCRHIRGAMLAVTIPGADRASLRSILQYYKKFCSNEFSSNLNELSPEHAAAVSAACH